MNLRRCLATNDDVALTVLRVVTGAVVLLHGVQKLFGWFGGHGPAATMDSFAQWFGLPPAVTFLVILSDSVGAFLLILGATTRFVAATTAAVMLGAITLVHGKNGFYMNWYTEPRGEGFEYHLLVLAMVIVLMMRGGGRYSVDRWIVGRLASPAA